MPGGIVLALGWNCEGGRRPEGPEGRGFAKGRGFGACGSCSYRLYTWSSCCKVSGQILGLYVLIKVKWGIIEKTDKVVHALECIGVLLKQLGPLSRAKAIPVLMDPFEAQLGERVSLLPQQSLCKLFGSTEKNIGGRAAKGFLRASQSTGCIELECC